MNPSLFLQELIEFRTNGLGASADISECRAYRYSLRRWWSRSIKKRWCVFIMLNPSTADAMKDDPTIRRCIDFAQTTMHQGLWVVNLFAFRATKPSDLERAEDPVGGNDLEILEALTDGATIVCAWGAHPIAAKRAGVVLGYIRKAGKTPMCLGTTKAGTPRHPLYVPRSQPFVTYEPRGE